MKVIFLDIDGVLNTERSTNMKVTMYEFESARYAFDQFDPEALANLNKIIEATDARVVISSNWRLACQDPYMENALRDHFKANGFEGYIIGMTGIENFSSAKGDMTWRGTEIKTWIDDHPKIKVESYVIIDDRNPPTFEKHPGKLVQTDPVMGIKEEDAEAAIKILNT